MMFSMFALGNAMFACGVRNARERSLEEDRGETKMRISGHSEAEYDLCAQCMQL